MSLPPAGPVPVRIELADQAGVLVDQRLGDETAEREREDVDPVEAERLDEGEGVVGHRLDAVGHLAAGAADAAVVEGDDVVTLAIGSMRRGSQLSRLAARWTKKTTGMPPFGPSSR